MRRRLTHSNNFENRQEQPFAHDTSWQRKPLHKPLKTLRTFPLISAHTNTGLCFSSHNVTSMTKRNRLEVKKEKTKPHYYCFEWKTIEEVVYIHSFIHMSLWKMWQHLRKVSRLPLNPLNWLIQRSHGPKQRSVSFIEKWFFHSKFNQSNIRAGIKKWEILQYSIHATVVLWPYG